MTADALRGTVVAVTGAGRGLGLDIAAAMLERGAHVIANYRSAAEGLQELDLKFPGRLTLTRGDVGEESAAQALAEAGKAAGGIEVLVHNAGITRDRILMQMSVEEWDEVQRVNLRGAFLTTKVALRQMLCHRHGRIIYLSSIVATMGNAGQANYAASKAGLHGLAATVAQEYAAYNIRSTVLAPGLLDVGLGAAVPDAARRTKLDRTLSGTGSSTQVAATVAFLAGPDAAFVNGAVIAMDGGVRF
jgi:3-oxoacyl-[acyl-carrier protein] reductase